MNAGVLFKKLNTKAAVTEFLGTGALTLVVALVTSSLSTLSRGQQAVGVGAAVLTLILTGLKSSGANYNPVISLSLLLLGKITLGRGILYLCSQVAGALTGGALARALVGSAGRLRDPSFLLSPPILCMESFFSFALVLLVLHASVSSGAQANGRNQHFAGAIAVFVSVAAALGASMNPAVASGALRLNDYCHTFFPWWTRDSSDPRSRVQLKHLLSFTSGYYQLTYGASVPCFRNASMDYLACVRELYETVELRWEPGTVWDYSSLHLKIAGGMAVAASGRSIRELLEETLAELGMTNSYYDMGQNPELAGSLWTTGA